jgi:hypothetical protein
MTDEHLKEYIVLAREEIKNAGEESNHCMILYKTRGQFNEILIVHAVYKNIDEFELKAKKDMSEIDSKYGINAQVWYYD